MAAPLPGLVAVAAPGVLAGSRTAREVFDAALRARGLRGSLVFTPTEATKLTATSVYQQYDLQDQTYVFITGTRNYTRPNTVPEPQKSSFFMNRIPPRRKCSTSWARPDEQPPGHPSF